MARVCIKLDLANKTKRSVTFYAFPRGKENHTEYDFYCSTKNLFPFPHFVKIFSPDFLKLCRAEETGPICHWNVPYVFSFHQANTCLVPILGTSVVRGQGQGGWAQVTSYPILINAGLIESKPSKPSAGLQFRSLYPTLKG